MATEIEFTPSASPFTGLNSPTQQVYAAPAGWDSANWTSARVPMQEDANNAGRYFASVDESLSSAWLIYVATATPAYWTYVATAVIPSASSSGGSGSGARLVTVTVTASGSPVQSASVRFSRAGESYVATTNGSGVAQFALDDGSWTVGASKAGLIHAPQTVAVSSNMSVSLSMAPTSVPPPPPFTGLCSVIFAVSYLGEPVVGATIEAILQDQNPMTASHLISRQITSGVTDANGNCTLYLIRHSQFTRGGKYRIKVGDQQGRILHDRVVTVPNQDSCNATELPDG